MMGTDIVWSYQYDLTDADCEAGLACRKISFQSIQQIQANDLEVGRQDDSPNSPGLCTRSCDPDNGKIVLLQFDCVMETSRTFSLLVLQCVVFLSCMDGTKGILQHF